MEDTARVLLTSTQDNPQKSLLTIPETAAQIGGTVWMWRTLIWGRQIPVVKIGRKFFLERTVVEHFYQSRSQLHI